MPHALAGSFLISCMSRRCNTHAVLMVHTEMTLHATPDGAGTYLQCGAMLVSTRDAVPHTFALTSRSATPQMEVRARKAHAPSDKMRLYTARKTSELVAQRNEVRGHVEVCI